MNTAKPKRWNGKIETLPAAYLNRVLEQMLRYGDRVQFALTGGGPHPQYQVINAAEKKMTFDGNHLLTYSTDAFANKATSLIYTLEQIEAATNGAGQKAASAGGRSSAGGSGGGPRTSAAQKLAQVEAEKYAYFKQHRATLPAEIGKHAAEITALMMNGLPAEDAFAEVSKRCL
ncbi:MAG TPA: hypothetical protein VF798_10440 [Burkholderiaceae bacterium]